MLVKEIRCKFSNVQGPPNSATDTRDSATRNLTLRVWRSRRTCLHCHTSRWLTIDTFSSARRINRLSHLRQRLSYHRRMPTRTPVRKSSRLRNLKLIKYTMNWTALSPHSVIFTIHRSTQELGAASHLCVATSLNLKWSISVQSKCLSAFSQTKTRKSAHATQCPKT